MRIHSRMLRAGHRCLHQRCVKMDCNCRRERTDDADIMTTERIDKSVVIRTRIRKTVLTKKNSHNKLKLNSFCFWFLPASDERRRVLRRCIYLKNNSQVGRSAARGTNVVEMSRSSSALLRFPILFGK